MIVPPASACSVATDKKYALPWSALLVMIIPIPEKTYAERLGAIVYILVVGYGFETVKFVYKSDNPYLHQ